MHKQLSVYHVKTHYCKPKFFACPLFREFHDVAKIKCCEYSKSYAILVHYQCWVVTHYKSNALQ